MVQNVLVCGWGDTTFMISLLHCMDEELPKDSQVMMLNTRSKECVMGERPLCMSKYSNTSQQST